LCIKGKDNFRLGIGSPSTCLIAVESYKPFFYAMVILMNEKELYNFLKLFLCGGDCEFSESIDCDAKSILDFSFFLISLACLPTRYPSICGHIRIIIILELGE